MYAGSDSLPQGQATCQPCRAIAAQAAGRARTKTAPFVPELRFCKICSEPFETKTNTQVYCSAECRSARNNWSNTTRVASAEERGYGKEHRDARAAMKALITKRGGIDCCICGGWINAGDKWHLDHNPERTGYRGAAHPACNVRDGASRGASRSSMTRRYEKRCPTCAAGFVTAYPKQTYCSAQCRPKSTPKPKPPRQPIACVGCGATIRQGKRCARCRAAHNRTEMRNRYRVSAGIPLDAPRYDRSWRAA